MTTPALGAVLHAYFKHHLQAQKGLSATTIKSYRDALVLFLGFVARDRRCRLTRVALQDLTADRVVRFLDMLESERHNHVRSRNHRLTALKSFFDFLVTQEPAQWAEAERVIAIPSKRVPPPTTSYLERDEVNAIFAEMPRDGSLALRDRTLLLFLYNTGARVSEATDLQIRNLELERRRVHLHGKGDKWRVCPLWDETVALLRELIGEWGAEPDDLAVFRSQRGTALTRFGIYKLVRRHTKALTERRHQPDRYSVSPHCIRHTTAMHLLESGVEVNVIRAWLGHVSVETTNRYAEINAAAKSAALDICAPPENVNGGSQERGIWRDDPSMLRWLQSL